jgi:hypothetical protein
MPGKKGGYDQLYNLQALAGRGQVIATHDSTADTYALHPLLEQGAANLAAAGIADKMGTALFDAGYADEDNFTAGCPADLYVAVTRESVQAGRQPGGTAPLPGRPGWRAMAAKLDTPDGRAVYKQRKAIIEPVFAQLFARFGRTLHYRGDMVTTEIHLWAAVRNLLKAIRARARREQRERQAAARPALAAAYQPPRPASTGAVPAASRKTPGNDPARTCRTAGWHREPHPGNHNQDPRHAGIPAAGHRQVMRQPPSGMQISAMIASPRTGAGRHAVASRLLG